MSSFRVKKLPEWLDSGITFLSEFYYLQSTMYSKNHQSFSKISSVTAKGNYEAVRFVNISDKLWHSNKIE